MTRPVLIVVTDDGLSEEHICESASRFLGAVPRASTAIQLRDKRRLGRALLALAERLAAICEHHGAPLYVNDRLDIALAVRASGVHLGERSVDIADVRALLGHHVFVSIAAHELSDIDRARREGADAALVSPIFANPEKGPPRGTGFIAEARARAAELGLYGLGGVDASNARACVAAGADGVAVIRAVWSSDDVARAATSLVAAAQS
jgi:thiamine-phosphate pyrophosphorylase